jgi:hypothetical protein
VIYLVHFTLDGIRGREAFASERPSLDGYLDAQHQFWELVSSLGARRVEPVSAWEPATVFGPTLLTIERVQAEEVR